MLGVLQSCCLMLFTSENSSKHIELLGSAINISKPEKSYLERCCHVGVRLETPLILRVVRCFVVFSIMSLVIVCRAIV